MLFLEFPERNAVWAESHSANFRHAEVLLKRLQIQSDAWEYSKGEESAARSLYQKCSRGEMKWNPCPVQDIP